MSKRSRQGDDRDPEASSSLADSDSDRDPRPQDGDIYEVSRALEEEIAAAKLAFDKNTFIRQDDGELISLFDNGIFSTGDALRNAIPTLGHGVSVRPSTLGPSAGRGLFVDRTFKQGEIITYYDGQMIRVDRLADLPPQWRSHARAVYRLRFALLGNYGNYGLAPDGTGGGAFANTLDKGDALHGFNSEYVDIDTITSMQTANPFERVIVLKALRRIPAGSEVFISYGNTYVIGEDAGHVAADITPFLVTRDTWRSPPLPSHPPTPINPPPERRRVDLIPVIPTPPPKKKRRFDRMLNIQSIVSGGGSVLCFQCGKDPKCYIAQRFFCSHACLFKYSLDEVNEFPPHEVVLKLRREEEAED